MNYYESQKFLWWCTKFFLLTPIYYDRQSDKIRIHKILFAIYTVGLIGFLIASIRIMLDNFLGYFTLFDQNSSVKIFATLCEIIGFIMSSIIIILNSLYQYKGQVIVYNKLLLVDQAFNSKLNRVFYYGPIYRRTNIVLFLILLYYYVFLMASYLIIFIPDNRVDFIYFQIFFFVHITIHHLILLLMHNLIQIIKSKFELLNNALQKYCRPRIQLDKYEEYVNVKMEYDTNEIISIFQIHSLLCSVLQSFNKGFGCVILGLNLNVFLLLIKELFELSIIFTHLSYDRPIKSNVLKIFIVDICYLIPYVVLILQFYRTCGTTTDKANDTVDYIQQFDDYILNDYKLSKYVSP